jgi:hypothetical protein
MSLAMDLKGWAADRVFTRSARNNVMYGRAYAKVPYRCGQILFQLGNEAVRFQGKRAETLHREVGEVEII